MLGKMARVKPLVSLIRILSYFPSPVMRVAMHAAAFADQRLVLMTTIASQNLKDAVKLRRIELLYSKLPASIGSAALGVFLACLALSRVMAFDSLMIWGAGALSTLVLRGILWYVFSNRIVHADEAGRWETLFAIGALLSGLGWGVISGPMFPVTHPEIGNLFLLGALIISFSTAVLSGISHWAFFALVIPTLLPSIWRAGMGNADAQFFTFMMGAMGVVMVVIVQRSMRKTLLDNVHHRLESELLLAEQQAIFQSATLGIAVVQDKRIIKANPRLAELFGRPASALLDLSLESCFTNLDELDLMLEESDAAFRRAQSFHGAYRLKRGDGTQFWAEFSGRRMDGDGPPRNVWLIGEAPLRLSPATRQSGHS